jgi:hypothetical protein
MDGEIVATAMIGPLGIAWIYYLGVDPQRRAQVAHHAGSGASVA